MSENAILTMIVLLWGVIQLLVAGILGWVALEIRHLNKTVGNMVRREDCESDMCRHSDEIRNLWEKSREHGERIAKIEN